MGSFPKYKLYKNSRVDWIGKVPIHWDILRAKRIFKEVSEKNHADSQLLSVTQSQGVVPRDILEQRVVMPIGQLQTFKLVREDDFVISLRSFQGGIEYSEYEGLVRPAYTVLRKKIKINSGFLKHLLKSYGVIYELNKNTTGIRQGKNIDFKDFSLSFLPIPNETEQRRISTFLDQKTAEIDETIKKKQRLIELLKEQKAVLINQAVTKGLDPNATMQDSGVAWIGDIPAHWKKIRLKNLMKRIEQGWSPLCFNQQADSDEWGVLKVGCVNGYTFNYEENKKLPPYLKPKKELQISHNDILISRANSLELVGSAACAINPRKKLLLCDKLYRATINKSMILHKYFILLLQSKSARSQIEIGAHGASPSMQNIGQSVITNLWVACPPIKEQDKILTQIEKNKKQIEEAIKLIKKEISALSDLKSTLISDAVTGKIKI